MYNNKKADMIRKFKAQRIDDYGFWIYFKIIKVILFKLYFWIKMYKTLFAKISLLWFLFCSFAMAGQQPATIHLTEKGGLPDIEFYNIIEDTEKTQKIPHLLHCLWFWDRFNGRFMEKYV